MAIVMENEYVNSTPANAAYPHGSFKSESAPAAGDGTPVDIAWANDIIGFLQKLLAAAGITPSGAPDTVLASDYYSALMALADDLVTTHAAVAAPHSGHMVKPTGGLNFKPIPIGDWNMDATLQMYVTHGLTFSKIIGARVMIRDDADGYKFSLPMYTGYEPAGYGAAFRVLSTTIHLVREAGGYFDQTLFDSTSFNRGHILLEYID